MYGVLLLRWSTPTPSLISFLLKAELQRYTYSSTPAQEEGKHRTAASCQDGSYQKAVKFNSQPGIQEFSEEEKIFIYAVYIHNAVQKSSAHSCFRANFIIDIYFDELCATESVHENILDAETLRFFLYEQNVVCQYRTQHIT